MTFSTIRDYFTPRILVNSYVLDSVWAIIWYLPWHLTTLMPTRLDSSTLSARWRHMSYNHIRLKCGHQLFVYIINLSYLVCDIIEYKRYQYFLNNCIVWCELSSYD